MRFDEAVAVKVGAEDVAAVYVGTVQVWPTGPPPPLFSASWPGAASSAWPSPWVTAVSGSGSHVQQVGDGTGRVASGASSGRYGYAGVPIASADVDILARIDASLASSSQGQFRAVARWDGGISSGNPTNAYLLVAFGFGNATLYRCAGGTATSIASVASAGAMPTVDAWLRFQVVGSTIRARSWADGDPEPATWTLSATDGAVTAAGQAGIGLYSNSSHANALIASSFEVTAP